MKFFKRLCLSVISLILCVAMLTQTVVATEVKTEPVYVKDIKIIYADSEREAKEQLPSGYTLINGDVNTGTGEVGVYLCYSVTKDPNEAITDIKVMHEGGGFEVTDFGKTLNDAVDGVYGLAQEMTSAISEFAQNYKEGVPAALYAKEALDYFLYDDKTTLGDFMISGSGTYQDYGKMILMCHEDILNAILSILALGVQGKAGENWIDKLADVDPYTYDSTMDMIYRERATKLRPVLQQFNDIYCYVLGYYDETYTVDDLTEENDKELFAEMAENKDLFAVIQTILQSYTVGVVSVDEEWTAEDMFAVGLNETINMYDIYALLDCLTPGQEIMLRLTGPYNFIIGSQNTDEVLQEARRRLVEQLDINEKVPIWDGVNLDMFHQEVGLTNDTMRSMAAGKQYDIFAKDVDTLSQKYRDIASVVTTCFTIASSAILVTKCALVLAPKFFSLVSLTSVASAISSFASAAIVSNILLGLGLTFMVLGIVCAIIVWFVLEDIINWILSEDYVRTSIPTYMVDEIVNNQGISTYAYYRRVDNVKSDEELDLDAEDNESGSDINANKGYRWMSLYTSNRAGVGNPIEAKFLVAGVSGTDREGYRPLTMFGSTEAVNLNSYADQNSAEYPSVYLFYVQDQQTPVTGDKIYISDVAVESGIHEDAAKKKLRDRGYLILNHDYGCSTDESVYVGYKLTANASDAVRDIRLLYNFHDTGITFGDLKYAATGTIGNFTVMISSTNSNPAPPIVGLETLPQYEFPDPTLGYEPVNEFSGGLAQPLGRNDYRLYFLPETTFTEGPDYIAGIKTDVYYYNNFSEVTGWSRVGGYALSVVDKFGNDRDVYRRYKGDAYGELFFDYNSRTRFYFQARINGDSYNNYGLGFKYTTTKNPYRAVYGIAGTKLNGLDRFDDFVSYAGEGFVLSAVELSYNSSFYSWYDFPYAPHNNRSEFGPHVKSLTYEYYRGEREHFSSVDSPGKADASWVYPYLNDWEACHAFDTVMNQDITQVMLNEDMNALYLSGYQSDRTPLTVNDVIITNRLLGEGEIPDNFTAVCSMVGDSTEPMSLAPTNSDVKIGEYATWGGFSSRDICLPIFGEKAYIYFRNEKTVDGEPVAQGSLKEGKYISGIFLSSREEIRELSLKKNPDLLCENISKGIVESNLLGKGATTTYDIHINTDFSKKDSNDNANYTYVGIARTDDPNQAIRDIRLYVAEKGEYVPKEMKRTITVNGVSFDAIYTLVGRESLTEQGNKSEADCEKERQVYVYVSVHPSLGKPITEIHMSDWFSYGDFEPVVTMNGTPFVSVYLENKDDIFVDDDYFMYGNHLSFRRDGEVKPYVHKLMVSSHEDGDEEAIAKLLNEGYTDIVAKELNDGAGGNYIYLGMKRTADAKDAVYDILLTNDVKKPQSDIDGFKPVSDIDLNEDAGGEYIYLYEKRTPSIDGELPLQDIIIGGKNHKDYVFAEGDKQFQAISAVNQDGEMQDVNQKAGGDYIYLLKIKEIQMTANLGPEAKPHRVASIFGSGSIAVIAIFLVGAVGVGWYIVHQKKHRSVADDQETDEN